MLQNDIVPFVNSIRKNVIGWDNLWDDLVHREFPNMETSFPKDNIIKLENTVIIELALAGYKKENISIEREGSHIVVSANKEDREDIDEANYLRKHIATRAFTKRYTVAQDYKDIRARFKDGILSIHLEREPKPEEVKHTIEIS